MKTNQIIIASFVAMVAITSCKHREKLEKGDREITVPFSDKKYKSDKDFLRAKQVGDSPNLAAAKKIGLQNAKAELAGNINAIVKRVTEQYTNQRTVGVNPNFENKFEENAREVVDQSLNDIQIMDEKVIEHKDKSYSYWVAIQISKQAILDGVSKKISTDAKLQLDYDKKKFEDIFNSEMQKMEKDQQQQ